MAERDAFDAEAEERLWWERWWAEDYSWEGLGRLDDSGFPEKPWHGWVVVEREGLAYCTPADDAPDGFHRRPASLCDYWRADPVSGWRLRSDNELLAVGELTKRTFANKHWHIVHLPDRLPNGERAGWKANIQNDNWIKLDDVISVRMKNSGSTQLCFHNFPKSFDLRSQFDGAIIKDLPSSKNNENDKIFVSSKQVAYLSRLYLSDETIGEGSDFYSSIFYFDVDFSNSTFDGRFRLSNSIFLKRINFQEATFCHSVYFSDSIFFDYVRMSSTKFQQNCIFNDSNFLYIFDFGGSIVDGLAFFNHVIFHREARFGGAIFRQIASFSLCQFNLDLEFNDTLFYGRASFIDIKMLESEFAWSSAFSTARFEEFIDFRDSPYKLISMFDGARIEGGIAYPKPGEAEALRIFDKEVIAPILKGNPTERDEAFKAVEHGAQVLKHQMRLASDSLREQRFYRFELIARRLQSTTHWSERVSSRLFGWLADYGLSVSRPFGWLVVTMALCATAYFGLSRSAGLLDPAGPPQLVRVADVPGHFYREVPTAQDGLMGQVLEGPSQRLNALVNARADRITEAFTNGRGPILFAVELGFIPVSDPMGHHTWAKDLSAQDSWQGGLFAFLRMTQRLTSLILIFLTALALRRRFQIG